MTALEREITIIKYGVMGWFEKDRLSDDSSSFTCYKESGWSAFLLGILFMIGFESVAIQVLLHDHYIWLAYVHLFLALYGVLWLLGDYQAIKKNMVTLDSTALRVHIGLRWDFFVPFSNITGAKMGEPDGVKSPLEIKMSKFTSEEKLSGYEAVTVAGKPNLHLILGRPITVIGPFGRKKRMDRIGLSIDSTEKFIVCIHKKIQ
jgi:hypothetical protein